MEGGGDGGDGGVVLRSDNEYLLFVAPQQQCNSEKGNTVIVYTLVSTVFLLLDATVLILSRRNFCAQKRSL